MLRVLTNVRKLGEASEKFKGIGRPITEDHIVEQEREGIKRKVQEAKNLQTEYKPEEWLFRVRGTPGDLRIVWLIGSMSPWVLPERTLGTVRYTETYPGNYLTNDMPVTNDMPGRT